MLAALVAAVVVVSMAPAAAAATLEAVKSRGHLLCGVQPDAPGFSFVESTGKRVGLEADFCRALSAAVLGTQDAVEFVPLPDAERFRALLSGRVDVLAGGSSWTLSRDTELGARFAGALYHESQVLMVRRNHAVFSALELSGASICVLGGTRHVPAVSDYFIKRSMPFQLIVADHWDVVGQTYAAGGCTAITGDMSQLGALRVQLPDRDEHLLLPDTVAGEPLGPAVRQGDETWFSIVRWVLMALIRADELSVTSNNAEMLATSGAPEIRRLLGTEANIGQPIGLAATWAYDVIRQVGNYSEIFERNLGLKSELKLRRGLNGLWLNGGLLYAAPLR
ncbi:MAG: amino acid ABC transporter substrate-binding protein [Hyphomicrobiaceae bacterium]|nr:amino acid ABC transporter substrate-binding protein [Hyphomicrobiaceae bacterium]